MIGVPGQGNVRQHNEQDEEANGAPQFHDGRHGSREEGNKPTATGIGYDILETTVLPDLPTANLLCAVQERFELPRRPDPPVDSCCREGFARTEDVNGGLISNGPRVVQGRINLSRRPDPPAEGTYPDSQSMDLSADFDESTYVVNVHPIGKWTDNLVQSADIHRQSSVSLKIRTRSSKRTVVRSHGNNLSARAKYRIPTELLLATKLLAFKPDDGLSPMDIDHPVGGDEPSTELGQLSTTNFDGTGASAKEEQGTLAREEGNPLTTKDERSTTNPKASEEKHATAGETAGIREPKPCFTIQQWWLGNNKKIHGNSHGHHTLADRTLLGCGLSTSQLI